MPKARAALAYVTGLVCICLVTVLWTVATVIKQLIFNKFNYDQPAQVTAWSNACYVVLVPSVLVHLCRDHRARQLAQAAVNDDPRVLDDLVSSVRRSFDRGPGCTCDSAVVGDAAPGADAWDGAASEAGLLKAGGAEGPMGLAEREERRAPSPASVRPTSSAAEPISGATSSLHASHASTGGAMTPNHNGVAAQQRCPTRCDVCPRPCGRCCDHLGRSGRSCVDGWQTLFSSDTTSPWAKHATGAAGVTPVWFLAQWLYNVSVSWCSATQSTVAATSSCAWTYMIALIARVEKHSIVKDVGVILCLAGNVLNALSHSDDNSGDAAPEGTPETATGSVPPPSDAAHSWVSALVAVDGDGTTNGSLHAALAQSAGGRYPTWGVLVGLLGAMGFGVYSTYFDWFLSSDESSKSSCAPDEPARAEEYYDNLAGSFRRRSSSASSTGGLLSDQPVCGNIRVRHCAGCERCEWPHVGADLHVAAAAVHRCPACVAGTQRDAVARSAAPMPAWRSPSVLLFFIGVFFSVAVVPLVATAIGPPPAKIAIILLANGVLDNALSQYLWAVGIKLTSATVSSIGLSLTVPLAMVADGVRGSSPSPGGICGALLVVAAFAVMSVEDWRQRRACAEADVDTNVGGAVRGCGVKDGSLVMVHSVATAPEEQVEGIVVKAV